MLDTVKEIITSIKERGDKALIEYTREFDGVDFEVDKIKVSQEEIQEAYKKMDEETIEAIRTLAGNVKRFHAAQMPNKMWCTELSPGLVAGQIIIPLDKVGCYVPGGRGWFPSAVMMSVLPAKVAGVSEVIVCTPSAPDGLVPAGTLVACVLPTGRKATVAGGLNTAEFYKTVTFENFSKEGLDNLKDAMVKLADYEGFPAHGNAILERFARD